MSISAINQHQPEKSGWAPGFCGIKWYVRKWGSKKEKRTDLLEVKGQRAEYAYLLTSKSSQALVAINQY